MWIDPIRVFRLSSKGHYPLSNSLAHTACLSKATLLVLTTPRNPGFLQQAGRYNLGRKSWSDWTGVAQASLLRLAAGWLYPGVLCSHNLLLKEAEPQLTIDRSSFKSCGLGVSGRCLVCCVRLPH